MKNLIIIGQWVMALSLLPLTFYLKDPWFLKIRAVEFLSIISIAMILGGVVIHNIYSNRQLSAFAWERYSLLLWLVTISIIATNKEMAFHLQQYRVINSEVKRLQEFGKHFIIGYLQLEDILPLVSKGAIGGIFITQRNVAGKTMAAIQQEICTLQTIQQSLGLPPLIVAADQEGGVVSRLSPPLTALPALSTLVAKSVSLTELQAAVKNYAEIQGQELANLGVNVNLSPVVDLQVTRQANLTDLHSLISERAIAADPIIVAQVALTYSQTLAQYGVISTLKHFPGLGSVSEDTHYFSADLNTPVAILEKQDWVPFKYVLKNLDIFMMLSHVKLTSLNSKQPVSLSYSVVQQFLREQWQHDGILITDDFNMRPIYSNGIESAVITALNAGVDLMLLSYDGAQYYRAMDALLQANHLNLSQLRNSQRRLNQLSQRLMRFNPSCTGDNQFTSRRFKKVQLK